MLYLFTNKTFVLPVLADLARRQGLANVLPYKMANYRLPTAG